MTPNERTGRTRTGRTSTADPRNWEEVNQRLACLGELERQMQVLATQFQEKMAVLKQQWLEAAQPIERERNRLREQIERFYWTHQKEILATGRKSVELAFGRLGSRRSCGVVVEEPASAQNWLAAHGLERYLRTRTEIDREAVRSTLLANDGSRKQEAAALASCPALHLLEHEEFWYEVHPASIAPVSAPPRTFRPSNGNGAAGKHLPGAVHANNAAPLRLARGHASPCET